MIDIKQRFCYLRPMRILVFTLVMLLFWSCSKLPESTEPVEPLQNVQFEFIQYSNNLHFSAIVQPNYLNISLDSVLVFWSGVDFSFSDLDDGFLFYNWASVTESELSSSYLSQIQYFINKKMSLTFNINIDRVYTYKPINLINISMGIGYINKTPDWIKLILQ